MEKYTALDMDNFTLDVKKAIQKNGYIVSDISYSKTKFGNSNYMYIYKDKIDLNNFSDGLKVRVSDHSVSNFDRIFNEVHIPFPPSKIFTLNRQLQEIDFRLNKNKFFKSEDGYEDNIVEMEVNENNLKDTDIVISERLSSGRRGAGRKIFKIRRVNKKPVINWVDIRNGKIFKTTGLYDKGGNTPEGFIYSIGGL